ncbi:class I SAM-dependent methyltransferase [Streptomyces sp. GLT-R25]
MALHANQPRALSFDAVAAQYAATRPDYPPALFDAVEELTGRPLADADVLDCGAGTGIATRLLRERGARVVAMEPGAGMAAELRRGEPEVPLVRGEGNRLPFAAASFDVVAYAQAWHWTDPARSVPEALRVLRPDGVLALWWNQADIRVPWVAAEEDRLATLHPRLPHDDGRAVHPVPGPGGHPRDHLVAPDHRRGAHPQPRHALALRDHGPRRARRTPRREPHRAGTALPQRRARRAVPVRIDRRAADHRKVR